MSPYEIHDVCHSAMLECPQFHGYDDDTYISGYGEFVNIPKKGYATVIKFWREETTLFDSGYDAALPPGVQELFEQLDDVINKAINAFMEGV